MGVEKSYPHQNSILKLPSLYLCMLCTFIAMQDCASDWFAFLQFQIDSSSEVLPRFSGKFQHYTVNILICLGSVLERGE